MLLGVLLAVAMRQLKLKKLLQQYNQFKIVLHEASKGTSRVTNTNFMSNLMNDFLVITFKVRPSLALPYERFADTFRSLEQRTRANHTGGQVMKILLSFIKNVDVVIKAIY